MRRSAIAVMVAAAAAPVYGLAAHSTEAASSWCGSRGSGLFACKLRGAVSVESNGVRASLKKKAATPIPDNATVRVDRKSVARMTFAGDALCSVGDSAQRSSLLIGRTAEGRLFRQDSGHSTCTFSRSARTVVLPCDANKPCPIDLQADASTIGLSVSTRARSATAEDGLPVTTVFDVCSGNVEVSAASFDGTMAVASSASASAEVNGVPVPDESFYSHVEVVQSIRTVVIDITTPDESGPCDDPEIVGQRRALGLS